MKSHSRTQEAELQLQLIKRVVALMMEDHADIDTALQQAIAEQRAQLAARLEVLQHGPSPRRVH